MTTRERFDAWVKSDSSFQLDFYYVALEAFQAGAAVPDGWQLVPKEPTPEMIKRGRISDPLGCDVEDEDADTVYRGVWFGMLAVAPEYKP